MLGSAFIAWVNVTEKGRAMNFRPSQEQGLVPGAFVRNPDAPDWGIGQVQSSIGNRVTVNFEECGKQVIDVSVVGLVSADRDLEH